MAFMAGANQTQSGLEGYNQSTQSPGFFEGIGNAWNNFMQRMETDPVFAQQVGEFGRAMMSSPSEQNIMLAMGNSLKHAQDYGAGMRARQAQAEIDAEDRGIKNQNTEADTDLKHAQAEKARRPPQEATPPAESDKSKLARAHAKIMMDENPEMSEEEAIARGWIAANQKEDGVGALAADIYGTNADNEVLTGRPADPVQAALEATKLTDAVAKLRRIRTGKITKDDLMETGMTEAAASKILANPEQRAKAAKRLLEILEQ